MIDEIIYMIASWFESALTNGELEDSLLELANMLDRVDKRASSDVLLLYSYVRALRVRVLSLRSKRGLSKARDKILSILYSLRRQNLERTANREEPK
jgi:hypothetical protein